LAKLSDRRVDSVLNIDEDLLRPKATGDLLSVYDFSVVSDQENEKFQRLSFDFEPAAHPRELTSAGMEAEVAELVDD